MSVGSRWGTILVCTFFIGLLLLGLLVVKDFGISWDGPLSRLNAVVVYKYVTAGDRELFTYRDRHYGTAFELPLVCIEKALNITDTRKAYLLRHALIFLGFYIGVIFFYLLCRYHFKSRVMGVIGSIFLVASPRIFSHAFYNSKDTILMSAFIVAAYTMIRYLDQKTIRWAVIHAISSAVLVDIRLSGLLVPLLTLIFMVHEVFGKDLDSGAKRKAGKSFIVYAVMMTGMVILLWPYLWESPVKYFLEAFERMAHFPWNSPVLYLGQYIKASCLPWHYLFVWMGVSIPEVYLVLFIIGLSMIAIPRFKKTIELVTNKRNECIFLMWLFIPILSILFLGTVLYDGWRHMYFIYPAFILLSLTGVKGIIEMAKGKTPDLYNALGRLALVIISINLLFIAWTMKNSHPYNNVFFNGITGMNMEQLKHTFEMDYWGLSFRKGLEYIAKTDDRELIKVLPSNKAAITNIFILPVQDRKRIRFVEDIRDADYAITNYRWQIGLTEIDEKFHVYSVTSGNARIMSVYSLKPKTAIVRESSDRSAL
jgi:hypothetical protein